jgi:hypothetical protein
MHSKAVAQVPYGKPVELLVLAYRAMRFSPPEPVAIHFMKRAKDNGYEFTIGS